jgi:dynein heavy chain
MSRPPAEGDVILGIFDQVYDDLINFIIVNCFPKMELLQCMQIRQACDLMEGLIPHKEHQHNVCTNSRLVL